MKELEGVISRGLPGMVGVRLKLGEGVAGRVAQTLQAMVIDDLRKWTGRSPKLADLNAIAVAAVPMVYSSKVIGVLTVYEIDKGDNPESRQYTQADLDLLAVFADTAAVAVNNARLFDETQQRLLEIQVLYQTSLAAIQINSVHSIAQRIVETLEQLMNWQNSSIWLIDAKNQKPRQIAHSNADTLENRNIG